MTLESFCLSSKIPSFDPRSDVVCYGIQDIADIESVNRAYIIPGSNEISYAESGDRNFPYVVGDDYTNILSKEVVVISETPNTVKIRKPSIPEKALDPMYIRYYMIDDRLDYIEQVVRAFQLVDNVGKRLSLKIYLQDDQDLNEARKILLDNTDPTDTTRYLYVCKINTSKANVMRDIHISNDVIICPQDGCSIRSWLIDAILYNNYIIANSNGLVHMYFRQGTISVQDGQISSDIVEQMNEFPKKGLYFERGTKRWLMNDIRQSNLMDSSFTL